MGLLWSSSTSLWGSAEPVKRRQVVMTILIMVGAVNDCGNCVCSDKRATNMEGLKWGENKERTRLDSLNI